MRGSKRSKKHIYVITMGELELDKLVETISSDKVGKNANDIMSMMKEVNAFLGEFQKTTNVLKSMGVLPLLVRAAAKKMNVDADTPLKTDDGIQPRSEAHKSMITAINNMDDAQLLDFSKRITNANKA